MSDLIPYIDYAATYALKGMIHIETALTTGRTGHCVANANHCVVAPTNAYALASGLLMASYEGFNQNRCEEDKLDLPEFVTKFALDLAAHNGIVLPLMVAPTEDDSLQNKA